MNVFTRCMICAVPMIGLQKGKPLCAACYRTYKTELIAAELEIREEVKELGLTAMYELYGPLRRS